VSGNKKLKFYEKLQMLKLLPGLSEAMNNFSDCLARSILLPAIEPLTSIKKIYSL
jgi:hypothetical protein